MSKSVGSGSLLILLLLSVSCSRPQDDSPAFDRDRTVVIGLSADFDSLLGLATATSDALHVIEEMLFLTLGEMDEHLQLKPRLAKSWEFSEDGTTITFLLRDDIVWSDGAPTTAHDVLFTYQLATHPETGYADRQRFDLVDTVIVIDDRTIQFRFKSAYADALLDLQVPILPQHVLSPIPPVELKSCDFNRRPLGNGPFILKEWRANDRVVFEANPRYFAGKPQMDHVIFRIIPDEAIMRANLAAGEVDFVPFVQHKHVPELAANPELSVQRYPDRGYSFLAFNLARPVFQKLEVRQAIAKAIDREQLITSLLHGNGRPVPGPILPYFPACDSSLDLNGHDPAAAQELLQKTGWIDLDGDGVRENGNRRLEFSIKTNANSRLRTDAAVMIQENLEHIGVKATPQLMEWNALVDEALKRHDFDALLLSWKTGYKIDPSLVWHSRSIENGYNLISYRSSRADSLLDAARHEIDNGRLQAIWHEFQREVVEDCPYVFLFSQQNAAVYRKQIAGVKADVRGYLINIEEWRKITDEANSD